MRTENNEIFNHDSDIDVTHKIHTVELNSWISQLRYIKKELGNLMGLCVEELNEKLANDIILERFSKKKDKNEKLLEVLIKYSNSRIDIAECEDTQCDMVYISEHETYRRSYLYHLDTYRKLKDEFFNIAQSKFSLLR